MFKALSKNMNEDEDTDLKKILLQLQNMEQRLAAQEQTNMDDISKAQSIVQAQVAAAMDVALDEKIDRMIQKKIEQINIEGLVKTQVEVAVSAASMDAAIDAKIAKKLQDTAVADLDKDDGMSFFDVNPEEVSVLGDGRGHRNKLQRTPTKARNLFMSYDDISYDPSMSVDHLPNDVEKQGSPKPMSPVSLDSFGKLRKKSNIKLAKTSKREMFSRAASSMFWNKHSGLTPTSGLTSSEEEESQFSANHEEGIENVGAYDSKLYRDSYALMIVSYPFVSSSWWFGAVIFILQTVLLSVTISEQGVGFRPLFNAPIHTSVTVSIAQFFAIVVALLMNTDQLEATKSIDMLFVGASFEQNRSSLLKNSLVGQRRLSGGTEMLTLQSDPKSVESQRVYRKMVLLPNLLKFAQGLLVLFTSFIIIVQSSDVIDLFENFLALQVISNIDDISFWLSLQGFFGKEMQSKADEVTKIRLRDYSKGENTKKRRKYMPSFHSSIALFVYITMVIGWAFVINGQVTGRFYRMKYPQCQVELQGFDIYKIGNGECDGGLYNRFECGFDGGDCLGFKLAYPECDGFNVRPSTIANGFCDEENNLEECGYDGGDCCEFSLLRDEVFHNGKCDANEVYNKLECKFDNGECAQHNKEFPGCFVEDVDKLRNGVCDGGDYFTPECNYDGGDCNGCTELGANIDFIGDGICNGGLYMSQECGSNDGGDCDRCFEIVEDPSLVGDGHCDLGLYLNETCNMDGGDCIWKQVGRDIYGESNFDKAGGSIALSGNGKVLSIGARKYDGNGTNSGHVRVYKNVDGVWEQLGVSLDGQAPNDEFGMYTALSHNGKRVAIGGWLNDDGGLDAGHVRVYDWIDGAWLQVGRSLNGLFDGHKFGGALSISGDGNILAIGSKSDNPLAPNVRVFEYNASSWVQLGNDIMASTGSSGKLGYSVSISSDGKRVSTGAPYYDCGTLAECGVVKVYELKEGSWDQIGGNIYGTDRINSFGISLELSGDGSRVVVGAEQNSNNGENSGQVRAFDYVSGSWEQVGQALDGEDVGDFFGHHVSISDDGLFIASGGYYNNHYTGHARVFTIVDGMWLQIGQDIDGSKMGDEFGSVVSLSADGKIVAISGRLNSDGVKKGGHIQVYSINS